MKDISLDQSTTIQIGIIKEAFKTDKAINIFLFDQRQGKIQAYIKEYEEQYPIELMMKILDTLPEENKFDHLKRLAYIAGLRKYKTRKEIAEYLGVGPTAVSEALRRYGIKDHFKQGSLRSKNENSYP